MTNEEWNVQVGKDVGDHFTQRKLEPNQPVDPAEKIILGIMCQLREKETLLDYNRLITKSYEKKGNRGSNISQLEKQPQQLIPPFKVL